MFTKQLAKSNPNSKAFMDWLKNQLTYSRNHASQETLAKMKSMNMSLLQKLYLQQTKLTERVIITNNPRIPIIKIWVNDVDNETLEKMHEARAKMLPDDLVSYIAIYL